MGSLNRLALISALLVSPTAFGSEAVSDFSEQLEISGSTDLICVAASPDNKDVSSSPVMEFIIHSDPSDSRQRDLTVKFRSSRFRLATDREAKAIETVTFFRSCEVGADQIIHCPSYGFSVFPGNPESPSFVYDGRKFECSAPRS